MARAVRLNFGCRLEDIPLEYGVAGALVSGAPGTAGNKARRSGLYQSRQTAYPQRRKNPTGDDVAPKVVAKKPSA
jgi:hypothetical protein